MSTPLEEWEVQDFLNRGINLLLVDFFWTRWLNRSELSDLEMGELAILGQQNLVEPWRHFSGPDSGKIRDLLLANAEEVSSGFQSWIQSNPSSSLLADGIREPLSRLVTADGFSAFTNSGFGKLAEISYGEADSLARKVKSLEHREWTPGDLPQLAVCATLGVLIASALHNKNYRLAFFLSNWFERVGCTDLIV
ncbi:hypothetical protein J7I98_04395 [Streptomyces sp. ISL-98]|uniref:hypothetical protein n=1 Tax=Streptomyces sp. ISL-98 TaxID=2819192 RepID=UPI001BEB2E75|nr:hypothetical protein [Streptomyces sp. ISL-98]MBT2505148.1 hypothetical protein [Streptomyces sp. ISL-98]